MKKNNVIQEKSFKFAEKVVKLYRFLLDNKKEYVLSKQFLRSGTSVGANIEEALGGTSSSDFTNKLSIAYKEARETKYWLRLLKSGEYINDKIFYEYFNDAEEICKILASIIKTMKDK